jgi:hypothetical protein
VPCINNVNKCSISTKINVGSQQSHTRVAMPLLKLRSILSAQQSRRGSFTPCHGPHASGCLLISTCGSRRRSGSSLGVAPIQSGYWVGKYHGEQGFRMINVTYQGDTLMTAYKGYGGSPMYPRVSFFTGASLTHSSRHHHEGPEFWNPVATELRNSGAA